MPICKTCENDKPPEQMRRYPSGGMTGKCTACYEAKQHGGKKTAKGGAVKRAMPEPSESLELTMLPGCGFRAAVVDEVLQITQTDSDGGEIIACLSRTEARVLFAHFHDWSGAGT